MGDRANVLVLDGESRVYLYTHWCGSRLPVMVREALRRNERWEDGSYLARMIFQAMVVNDNGATGFGISSVCGDGDDRIVEVDVDNQEVRMERDCYSFDEFCRTDYISWSDN